MVGVFLDGLIDARGNEQEKAVQVRRSGLIAEKVETVELGAGGASW